MGPGVGHTLPRMTGGPEAQGLVGKSAGSGALWPRLKSGPAPGWVIAAAPCRCLSSAASRARGVATRTSSGGRAVLREQHPSRLGAAAGIREAPPSPTNTKKTVRRQRCWALGAHASQPLPFSFLPNPTLPRPSLSWGKSPKLVLTAV